MESHPQLDFAGCPAARTLTRVTAYVLSCLFLLASPLHLLASTRPGDHKDEIKQMFDQQRWPEVVEAISSVSARDADLDYYLGVALAQLGRFVQARRALLDGHRLRPHDKRFPTELAGIAFKQKQYNEATRWMHIALRLDPTDDYSNDFLGTVYFLQGNLDAALKYWNRANKPQIRDVNENPQLTINPAILDHAFAFAPESVLRLRDLHTSESRLDGLGIFASYRFQLAARDDGNFDLVLRANERNGWGVNKWDALLSTFRGVFYQTIYLEYFNLHDAATNITSLIRWDAQKRRVQSAISGPLWSNPKFRYRAGVDLRNENWRIVPSFTGPAPLLGALNLRREAAFVSLTSFNSGRWDWSTSIEVSHRDYRSVFLGTALTSGLLVQGLQLKELAQIHVVPWRLPERRLVTHAIVSEQLGRIWSSPSQSFLKLRSSVDGHWFPQQQGDDFEMNERLLAGHTFGSPSFDELFMLGLERDNDLPMRAHIGTRDGRKGSAPLGRTYFLSNWEINKNLYDAGLFRVRLSPFLDSGKITDPLPGLGSKRWLWDTGAQLKFGIFGMSLNFTYGKDLRSGANAFYVTAQR